MSLTTHGKVQLFTATHGYTSNINAQRGHHMTSNDWAELPLASKLEILKQCDGVHTDLNDIFDCDSCNVLFLEVA